MLWEALIALLVGAAVAALVLEPLARPSPPPPVLPDPEDLEETPKGLALSALREIEFDRETGKLSDADYQALYSKYSAEALVLLRSEGSRPPGSAAPGDPVESLIAARVRSLQSGGAAAPTASLKCPTCGPRPEPDAVHCSDCGRRLAAAGTCVACGAVLPADGRFCESCGSAVAA